MICDSRIAAEAMEIKQSERAAIAGMEGDAHAADEDYRILSSIANMGDVRSRCTSMTMVRVR